MPDAVVTNATRDRLVQTATDAQQLLAQAKVQDPQLYQLLTARAISAGANAGGGVAVGAVVFLASHYGFHLDQDTASLLVGLGVLAGNYVTHLVQAMTAGLKR